MKKILLAVLIILSSIVLVNLGYAYPSGHIGLLTVSESANNTIGLGGTADLYLEVRPGSGRIFIDSFPLSKIDTQITMRFASEVACDLLDKDCSNYDFFYTITANSAVVGGPSAGAAASVLTVAVLDGKTLDNKTVMTGTINSGNLIGPVSGIPAKSLAAKLAGYKTILIPEWGLENNTPSSDLSIKVIKVSTLEDALYYFTQKNYTRTSDTESLTGANMTYSEGYIKIMSEIALDLCTKYGGVANNTLILPNLTAYGIDASNSSQDNFVLAMNALNNDSYYSAASFCFGGNVKILSKILSNQTNTQLKLEYAKLLGNISAFESDASKRSKSLSTISGLEAYMVVAERLSEAKDTLSQMNPENISAYQLAYSIERFDTAVEWSKFYDLNGQQFVMDEGFLNTVCKKKLSEAEERLNYLELYYPSGDIRDELSKAYDYYDNADYALCIFTSSKVKADSDIVLSAIFVPDNETSRLLDEKMLIAKRVILKQQQSDIFPVLGYSYYEYANTLKDTDRYSALLYSEYALELSNLDMYFKKRQTLSFPSITFNSGTGMFLLGLGAGILLTIMLAIIFSKMSKKRRKR